MDAHPKVRAQYITEFRPLYQSRALLDFRNAARALLGFGLGKVQIYATLGDVFLVASEVGAAALFQLRSSYMPTSGAVNKMEANAWAYVIR